MLQSSAFGPDKVNILLVDDQPAKLLSYQAILDELGENLITANSAREALDHLLRTDVAVVLVDVCMPELDGFELVGMIRQHPRFQRTAIIFVSAVHMTELDRLKGYEVGAVDYMPVPVLPEILRAKVAVFAELYRKSQQLEALNRELERRVAERTAELEAAAARLLVSEERLKLADKRKDEFLATLAHELRNPLAPIRTASHLLRSESISPLQRIEAHEVIERQLEQLVRLIDDLMDVSRITRGQITLRRSPIDLREAVRRAVETVRPLVDERRQSLEVRLAEGPMCVAGDLNRLAQVIGNLLDNASKYSPEAGRIEITAALEGGEAIVRVRDDGEGIPPENLEQVFELFTQLGGPAERVGGGLGIGLALVRRIVELHGGIVAARSDGAGRGSELVVRLPVALDADGVAPVPEPVALPALAAVASRRILVVDDNRDAADSLGILLRLAGHEVEVSYDGSDALETAAEFAPEIVLLDLAMPGLDGVETARRIRREPWGAKTALVAVSGWGQREDRQRTASAGFAAHLVKPVDEAELLRVLESVTSPRAAPPSARRRARASGVAPSL
jgi:signal transduction histidine kinase